MKISPTHPNYLTDDAGKVLAIAVSPDAAREVVKSSASPGLLEALSQLLETAREAFAVAGDTDDDADALRAAFDKAEIAIAIAIAKTR